MLGHGGLHVLTLLRAPKNSKHLSIYLFVWLSVCLTVVFWHIQWDSETAADLDLIHPDTHLYLPGTKSNSEWFPSHNSALLWCVCVVVHLWRWWKTLLFSHLMASSSVSLRRVSHTHAHSFLWFMRTLHRHTVLLMLKTLYSTPQH